MLFSGFSRLFFKWSKENSAFIGLLMKLNLRETLRYLGRLFLMKASEVNLLKVIRWLIESSKNLQFTKMWLPIRSWKNSQKIFMRKFILLKIFRSPISRSSQQFLGKNYEKNPANFHDSAFSTCKSQQNFSSRWTFKQPLFIKILSSLILWIEETAAHPL